MTLTEKIWNQDLNKFPTAARQLRRAFIDENIKCGWPVKWGNQWGIAYPDGRIVDTGLTSLSAQPLKDWVEFARKHEQ